MKLLQQQKQCVKRALVWLAFLAFAGHGASVYSFELLSEGAMDSVSAVSNESAEDFLNVAGPTAAGLRTDYEELPFDVAVDQGEIVRDEVETELDFVLTQEVEIWADTLRRKGELDPDIGIIERLPTDSFIEGISSVPKVDQVLDLSGTDGAGLSFEIGKIEKTKTSRQVEQLIITGDIERMLDTALVMRGSVERFMERAQVVDNRVNFEDPIFGNAYISNVRSRTNITFIDRTQE